MPSPSAAQRAMASELPRVEQVLGHSCSRGSRLCSNTSRVPEPGSRSSQWAWRSAAISQPFCVQREPGRATSSNSSWYQGWRSSAGVRQGPSVRPRSTSRASTACSTCSVLPMRRSTLMCGWVALRRASTRGRTWLPMVLLAARCRRTGWVLALAAPTLRARCWACSSRLRACGSRVRPAALSTKARPWRSNSVVPSTRSSCCSAALVADWDSPSAPAAATVEPWRTTAVNTSIWRKVMGSMADPIYRFFS